MGVECFSWIRMFGRGLFWTHFRVTKLGTLTSQYVTISHSRFGLQSCDVYKFAKDNLTFIIYYSKKAVCSLAFARTDLHIYINLLFNIFLIFKYYIYWGVCNYNKQLPKWSELILVWVIKQLAMVILVQVRFELLRLPIFIFLHILIKIVAIQGMHITFP